MDDVVNLRMVELAKAIREKQFPVKTVVEAYLSQIDRHNKKLNAVVTINPHAKDLAAQADAALEKGEVGGPLHGVPITVKDAFETKGLRTTSSYKGLARYVPQRDARVVARLKSAGAIILGKTNMPPLAMDLQTRSPLFGIANNPWDPSCTPGGSTGGGAASIAAELSAYEIGSDFGGSIRIPAHYCGVYGFKCSENLISMKGHIPDLPKGHRAMRHLGCVGFLARSVEDLRFALPIACGHTKKDGKHGNEEPNSDNHGTSRTYRIAWMDSIEEVPVSQNTRSIIHSAIQKISGERFLMERCSLLNNDWSLAWKVYGEIAGAELGASLGWFLSRLAAVQFRFTPDRSFMKRFMLRGLKLNVRGYLKALAARDILATEMDHFFKEWDALICPVTVDHAHVHCKTGYPISVDQKKMHYFKATMSYTTVFNLTGNPVVVVPGGFAGNGLPIGIQIVGRRGNDIALLAIADLIDKKINAYRRPQGSGFAQGSCRPLSTPN